MKYTNYCCLLLLVCFAALFNSFPAFGQKNWLDLKILSYNIHHANPPSLPNTINTDTIGGLINKYQPDLVALQEVDVNTSRSGRSLDEAKAIADKSGMYFRFAKAIDYAGGEYGIAILSKYPFDSFNVFRLPSANTRAEARVLAIGYFHSGKRPFGFACTHLDAEGDNISRLMQVKTIDSIMSLLHLPAVLAGDLNSEPTNPAISMLDQNFRRTCSDSCAYTFPSVHPRKTIDYIAVHKPNSFHVVQHRALQESFPSDHLPVMAELKLKAGTSKKK